VAAESKVAVMKNIVVDIWNMISMKISIKVISLTVVGIIANAHIIVKTTHTIITVVLAIAICALV
jgi:hypothetical protein